MSEDKAPASPAAGQFTPTLAGSSGPPPNASFEKLGDTPASAFPIPPPAATQSPPSTAPNPVGSGAGTVEDFATFLAERKAHVNELVADFEVALSNGHSEIAAITQELKQGGITARLGSLELAVASYAAPALSQAEHDSHDLLSSWFAGIKSHFQRVVAAVAQDKVEATKKAAAVAAEKAAQGA